MVVHLMPSNNAYRQFNSKGKVWVNYSWADIGACVLRWRAALQAEAFTGGTRIAILVSNGIEHVCMDQAAPDDCRGAGKRRYARRSRARSSGRSGIICRSRQAQGSHLHAPFHC